MTYPPPGVAGPPPERAERSPTSPAAAAAGATTGQAAPSAAPPAAPPPAAGAARAAAAAILVTPAVPAAPARSPAAGAGTGVGPTDDLAPLARRLDVLAGRATATATAGRTAAPTAAAAGATAASTAGATAAAIAATAVRSRPAGPIDLPALGGVRRRGPSRLPLGAGRPGDALRLAQVACWQLAVISVLAVRREPRPLLVAVAVGAGVLILLTAVRSGGRWLYQWIFAVLGFLTRRHRWLGNDLAPAAALLAAVSPGARVGSLQLGDRVVGVLTHSGGATLVLQPVGAAGGALVGADWHPLPVPAALLPQPDPDGPVVTCQLLVHTVPALVTPDRTTSAAASYWQLSGNRVPLHQDVWVALQVQRDLDFCTDDVLHTALGNAARRLLRRMRKEGRPLDPLVAEDLLPVVAAVSGLALRPPRREPGRDRRPEQVLREHWRGWTAAGVPHAVYRLRRVSAAGRRDSSRLIADLFSVPAETVTVSVAARYAAAVPADRAGPVHVEFVVDVAAADQAALAVAVRSLVAAAADHGATLTRLDGYQRAAIRNLLPLGGFLPW